MVDTAIGVIMPLVVGVILIILGIINMTGNIASLHSYHRARVTEENRKPFGRRVGLGIILIGIGVIAEGIMIFLSEKMHNEVFITVGMVLMIGFFVPGFMLMFAAMKKYNGGIF